ncbi:MAG: 6-carboxytetrahydropterin synthase [Bacteroidia bacterium]|nr:6-carboxytetrahydropterin synthase [Bacteroidia bacterium]
MSIIRISKEFSLEMAHALWNYKGKCKNLHGHSYRLIVTVLGKQNTENTSTPGMVIDFGDLKKIINTHIIKHFDHSFVIYKKAPVKQLKKINQLFQKLIITDFQPTCENLAEHFAILIQKHLPNGVKLYSVRLYETSNSFAEWVVKDNE